MNDNKSLRCRVGLHSWQTVTGVEPRIRRGELDGYQYVSRQRCRRAGCKYEGWMVGAVQPVPKSHARPKAARQ